MMASGVPVAEVARRLGVPPATLFRWRSGLTHTDLNPPFECFVLERWQRDLVADHLWDLLRGLIHSDGCRSLNTIRRGDKAYAYPRYFFSNESTDIIGVFTDALDQIGVRWRMCRPNLVAVSRRADVALMDEHIGPKR
jgi:hypothetical protein